MDFSSLSLSALDGGGGRTFAVTVEVSFCVRAWFTRLSGSSFGRFAASGFSSSCSSLVDGDLCGLLLLGRGFPANIASPSPSPSVAEKVS